MTVSTSEALYGKVEKSTDVVAVEEILRRLADAGPDMNFPGRSFGPMPQLLAEADDVTKLHAVCAQDTSRS